MRWKSLPLLILVVALIAGYRGWEGSSRPSTGGGAQRAEGKHQAEFEQLPQPLDLLAEIVRPHVGESRLDREIIRLQAEIRQSADPSRALERLGWLLVSKARASFDESFYTKADQCAICLDEKKPGGLQAMLLRGHVLHSMHRFKDAETLARRLVTERGAPFDFGLLGDVLMEQGRLDEAIPAYQRMLDLKPDLHGYARAAHVRWLKGDLAGAIEAMQMAVTAASPRDAESAAWVHTRLAGYEFQAARFEEAHRLCDAALAFQTNYPPALLLRGRLLLAEGFHLEAVDVLQTAAQLNPLPEYQWTLAEALTSIGRVAEAQSIGNQIRQTGPANDPRTCALYLATRSEETSTALRLAEGELQNRADVFTHDALAWSLAAAGRWVEAQRHIARALSEGTQDARLFYHAAHIALKSGETKEALRWREQAMALKHLLLPGERDRLEALARQQVQVSSSDVPFPPLASE